MKGKCGSRFIAYSPDAALVKDQLTLISLYWDDFEKRIGKKALQELVDTLLDKKLKLDKEFPNL
jgi:hypothetical protein